jgi:hypothetical protein
VLYVSSVSSYLILEYTTTGAHTTVHVHVVAILRRTSFLFPRFAALLYVSSYLILEHYYMSFAHLYTHMWSGVFFFCSLVEDLKANPLVKRLGQVLSLLALLVQKYEY